MQPSADKLLGLPEPRIAYVWIHCNVAGQSTLRRLVAGDTPRDHAALD